MARLVFCRRQSMQTLVSVFSFWIQNDQPQGKAISVTENEQCFKDSVEDKLTMTCSGDGLWGFSAFSLMWFFVSLLFYLGYLSSGFDALTYSNTRHDRPIVKSGSDIPMITELGLNFNWIACVLDFCWIMFYLILYGAQLMTLDYTNYHHLHRVTFKKEFISIISV